ncbi:hypothetical protein LSAT2_023533 [Lamellibrachia satsuma]|nr:hypothetical protein LSAT2_023533 [Lamellibrachia satsuma]
MCNDNGVTMEFVNIERLEKVCQRFRQHDLNLNGAKFHLFKTQVAYLGHSKEGVAVDPDKIARVRDWPTPFTQAELRLFLGLASYYRRHVSNFAKLARPLHALTARQIQKNIGDGLMHCLIWSRSATLHHTVSSISPHTLMFGQKPVDQLISNTGHKWNENYVQEQSDLIRRAQAKECLMSAADTDKQRRDRRAHAGPIPVGDRVLLT